jgi:hypothetical protein
LRGYTTVTHLGRAEVEHLVGQPPASTKLLPRRTKGHRRHWLVVVAREEDQIHEKLRRVLAADRHVRVIFDRRANGSRNPPWVTRSLRLHGFAVVPAVDKRRQESRSEIVAV